MENERKFNFEKINSISKTSIFFENFESFSKTKFMFLKFLKTLSSYNPFQIKLSSFSIVSSSPTYTSLLIHNDAFHPVVLVMINFHCIAPYAVNFKLKFHKIDFQLKSWKIDSFRTVKFIELSGNFHFPQNKSLQSYEF